MALGHTSSLSLWTDDVSGFQWGEEWKVFDQDHLHLNGSPTIIISLEILG